jgi:isopentenyldiphosphate isomerase
LKLDTGKSFKVEYSFVHEQVLIEKTVEYWIGYCSNTKVEISQPHEIKEFKWCNFEEALDLLTHQNSKEVLNEVEQSLLRDGK